jgi:regulator of sirC expression with transglutaminase-like and TPR domain
VTTRVSTDLTLHVALFSHVACRPESEIDLGQAALLIAEPEYDDLDVGVYLRTLDRLADQVQPRLARLDDAAAKASALLGFLLDEEGFRGNLTEYEDPRNSFLNEVLERRLGIPISLSVLAMEVARRCDFPLHGVSFPGHFLLRVERGAGRPGSAEQAVLLDPVDGQTLASEDLQGILFRSLGRRRTVTPEDLQVATKNAILIRMLSNLRNIYNRLGDTGRQQLAHERIRSLQNAAQKPPTKPGKNVRVVH